MSEGRGYKSDMVNGGRVMSKPYTRGHEKESSWPPSKPSGERGLFHIDKQSGELKEGYPDSLVIKFDRATAVITDEMPALKHMGNSRYYTSKSKFREATRSLGFEEIGDQVDYVARKAPDPKAEERLERDIARSYYEVRDGMAPLSELDKERCKIQNKTIETYNYDRRSAKEVDDKLK